MTIGRKVKAACLAVLSLLAGESLAQTGTDLAPLPFQWEGPCGWNEATARLIQMVGEAWFNPCVLFGSVDTTVVGNVWPVMHGTDVMNEDEATLTTSLN